MYAYNAINILKGIGILMIILVHNRHFVLQGDLGNWNLVNFGQMGCQVCFVASGFGLMASRAKNKKTYTQYLLRRYKRILPGFGIALLINLLLNIILIDLLGVTPGFVMNRDPKGILLNLTLLHGLSPNYINNVSPAGWYIGTAFVLYLLFPMLAQLMEWAHKKMKGGALLVPLIFFIFNRIVQELMYRVTAGELYPYNNSFMYFLFINQLPVFLLGIEMFLAVKDGEHRVQPPFLMIGAGMLMIFASIMLFMQPAENTAGFRFAYIPTIMGCGMYCLGIGLVGLEELQGLGESFVGSFVKRCGEYSYGLYLVHPLFSWYGLRALTSFLQVREIKYNDKVLYIVAYPAVVFLTYWFGKWINKLLSRI